MKEYRDEYKKVPDILHFFKYKSYNLIQMTAFCDMEPTLPYFIFLNIDLPYVMQESQICFCDNDWYFNILN